MMWLAISMLVLGLSAVMVTALTDRRPAAAIASPGHRPGRTVAKFVVCTISFSMIAAGGVLLVLASAKA